MATSKTKAKQAERSDSESLQAQDNQGISVESTKTTENLVANADGFYAINKGICSTCIHQPNCLFVKAIRQPIHFCDEFNNVPDDNKEIGLP